MIGVSMAETGDTAQTPGVAGTPDMGAPETLDIGVATRAVSWVIDFVIINVVSTIAGVGVLLVLSIFPIAQGDQTAFKVVGGVAYALWFVAYFVAFWSLTGQTPGARVMQIRLVTSRAGRVKPVRALVRFIGMELAIIPFCAGYIPILFRRRGFPDWLAHTLVLDAPQLSIARSRQLARRAAAQERAAAG